MYYFILRFSCLLNWFKFKLKNVLKTKNVSIKNVVQKQDRNKKCNTALHVAIHKITEHTNSQNVVSIIRLLIKNGAQIDDLNAIGKTPLMLLKQASKKVLDFDSGVRVN